MMRKAWLVAAVAVAGFTAATLAVYQFRPTPGAVFLTLGWMAILATGYLLAKAASFDMRAGEVAGPGGRREELEREKKLLLKAIKECEFDRDTGKLEGGEAADSIRRYRARAVEILRQLDEAPGRRYEPAIEQELARRLAAEGCPACGTKNDEDAAFCKKCGAKVGA
jgi:hypothetical protein